MNLILLFESDFTGAHTVRLTGRRRDHLAGVHRAQTGGEVTVGMINGRLGRGEITAVNDDAVDMRIRLDADPPPALDLTLVLALPRPKVLNRVIAAVASMGIKRLFLINAWRVEKSYWKSPRLWPESIRDQSILGLEQARDTILPAVELRRFFTPFIEDELPSIARGTTALIAHPYSKEECPRAAAGPVTLVIGPEGGFISEEIDSLRRAGFQPVSLGPRVLRVETAVAALVGRLK